MKKIFFCLLFSSFLFSEETVVVSLQPRKVNVQVAPYLYGNVFQPGYGVSFRTQVAGHSFEVAPMALPQSGGFFGSNPRIGVTGSYYYAFFRDKVFQPYLGVSYTYLHELGKSTENLVSNLIGIQFASLPGGRTKEFPGYLFIDVQGVKVDINRYYLGINFQVLPRVGLGLQF